MKIEKIDIKAFRGFAKPRTLELADVNIVGGPNGFGKTSVFDAVHWALFGVIPRLTGTRDFVLAKDIYQNKLTDEACSVSVEISDDRGQRIAIERTAKTCTGKFNDQTVHPAVCLALLGLDGPDGHKAFLRRSLLEQERIVEFLRDLNPRDRYNSFVSLLQFTTPELIIDKSNSFVRAAREALDQAQQSLSMAKMRITQLQSEIDGLTRIQSTTSYEIIEQEYANIVAAREAAGPRDGEQNNQGSSRPALRERLKFLANSVADDVKECRAILPLWQDLRDLVALQGSETTFNSQLLALRTEVTEATTRLSSIDSQIDELKAKTRQLNQSIEQMQTSQDRVVSLLSGVRALVSADVCPVCRQPISRASLLKIIDDEIGHVGETISAQLAGLQGYETQLRTLQAERDRIQLQQRRQQEEILQISDHLGKIRRRNEVLEKLNQSPLTVQWNLKAGDPAEVIGLLEQRVGSLEAVQRRIVSLAGQVDLFKATDLLPEKYAQLDNMQRNLPRFEEEMTKWMRAEQLFKHWVEVATAARTNIVETVLNSHKPLIQTLYARFQPHPIFTEIDFEIRRAFGDAELYLLVYPRKKQPIVYPPTVFSTNQLNALALCTFLVLNLRSNPALRVLMLDDPIQSMDDLNLLGFCDVIRQLKGMRQLVISTHSRELYGLLMNKLRPVTATQTLKGFWFEAWTEDGPAIQEESLAYVPNDIDLTLLRGLGNSRQDADLDAQR